MNYTHLTVVRSGLPLPVAAPGELVVSDTEVRAWVRDGRIRRHLRKYAVARLVTERLSTSGRPMLMWALRVMARECSIVDQQGLRRRVTLPLLLRWSRQLGVELAVYRRLLRRVERDVGALAAESRSRPRWDRHAPVLYLRTDLSFGVRAGGSVGHIAGVVNELARIGAPPVMLSTAPVPTVDSAIEMHLTSAPEAFWNFRELPTMMLNEVFYDEALRVLKGRAVSFVYQRYSLNNYAGIKLARHLGVPFVVEYNGSEIWMSRHWSRRLKYEAIAERIERLNVTHADLVVVVSRAMRDELAARGLAHERVLVNPNGVDTERYAPSVDGTAVRQRYDLGGSTVIGFISTFQPWHGAEMLARAFVRLLEREPAYRERVRLLMIGTGPGLEAAREIIRAGGCAEQARFTGLVEQEQGPQHLAACDILVSPHVPNPDGTPFFGSPTKLFEYMAIGKAIIASDLAQLGEVLRHGETAWMVPPADADALAAALQRVVDDHVLRMALGAAARRAALAEHTWQAHVRKILAALESVAGATAA